MKERNSNDNATNMTDTLTTLPEAPIEDAKVTMCWEPAIVGFEVHANNGVIAK